MTVAELIDKLKEFDSDLEVATEQHYNDEQGGVAWYSSANGVYVNDNHELVVGS